MDGENRLRARADPGGDVLGVEIHRRGIDVRENGSRSATRNRFCGRIERERRTDHFVARSDPERVHDEHECVGAVGDADGFLYAEVVRRLALESGHVRPQDERAAGEHAVDRLADAREKRLVLCLDVNQRNRAHGWKV